MNRLVQRFPSQKLLHNGHHTIKLVTVAAFPPLLALFQGFPGTPSRSGDLNRDCRFAKAHWAWWYPTLRSPGHVTGHRPSYLARPHQRLFELRTNLPWTTWRSRQRDDCARKVQAQRRRSIPCCQKFGRVGEVCLITARPSKSI